MIMNLKKNFNFDEKNIQKIGVLEIINNQKINNQQSRIKRIERKTIIKSVSYFFILSGYIYIYIYISFFNIL